jgi:hypothetical protein
MLAVACADLNPDEAKPKMSDGRLLTLGAALDHIGSGFGLACVSLAVPGVSASTCNQGLLF